MGSKRRTAQRDCYDPAAAVYDPTTSSSIRAKVGLKPLRKSPLLANPSPLPTRFPDDDHSYQPVRRVQVTRLQHNTLPPPPSPSSSSSSSSSSRRRRQRLANLTDSVQWGFPVRYSPSQELEDQWRRAKEQEEAAATERERLEQLQRHEQRQARRNDLVRQDYALYLYLASKYGPLDAILFCCSPFPGRLYAVLVEQSARKLQKWRFERLVALRKYWIVTLARQVVWSASCTGVALVQQAKEHQRRAGVFLNRLRWRFAASAFRSWFAFTQKQIEVRWRFQFAMQEDVRARFMRWRERVENVKQFKRQLRQVATRKQMQGALMQWQAWQTRQLKLRTHLQSQWTKRQRECMAIWRMYVTARKIQRLAATRIQSQWRKYRLHAWFTRRRTAGRQITTLAKAFVVRRFVGRLRQRMEMVQVMEQMVRVLEWDARSAKLGIVRAAAVETELTRATREAQYIGQAEQNATAFVTSELDKVRKNDMHHRLQSKIRGLQDTGGGGGSNGSGNGGRTQELLVREATRLLILEVASTARQNAQSEFRSQCDSYGDLLNQPACLDGQCCVCTASDAAMELPFWLNGCIPPRESQQHGCTHYPRLQALDPMDLDQLSIVYADITGATRAEDARIRCQLLQNAIPMPILWKLLHQ